MRTRTKAAIIGTVLVGAAAASGGVAFAGADDENDAPITGSALERASEAALQATGGGRVTETELGDEESYYEVEVTLPDGSQTDVQLDRDYNVVGSQTDTESETGE